MYLVHVWCTPWAPDAPIRREEGMVTTEREGGLRVLVLGVLLGYSAFAGAAPSAYETCVELEQRLSADVVFERGVECMLGVQTDEDARQCAARRVKQQIIADDFLIDAIGICAEQYHGPDGGDVALILLWQSSAPCALEKNVGDGALAWHR